MLRVCVSLSPRMSCKWRVAAAFQLADPPHNELTRPNCLPRRDSLQAMQHPALVQHFMQNMPVKRIDDGKREWSGPVVCLECVLLGWLAGSGGGKGWTLHLWLGAVAAASVSSQLPGS